jgi:hypothetical protein
MYTRNCCYTSGHTNQNIVNSILKKYIYIYKKNKTQVINSGLTQWHNLKSNYKTPFEALKTTLLEKEKKSYPKKPESGVFRFSCDE